MTKPDPSIKKTDGGYQIRISLDAETYQALSSTADREGQPIPWLVQVILREALKIGGLCHLWSVRNRNKP